MPQMKFALEAPEAPEAEPSADVAASPSLLQRRAERRASKARRAALAEIAASLRRVCPEEVAASLERPKAKAKGRPKTKGQRSEERRVGKECQY